MTKRAYLELIIVSLFVAGCLEEKYTYTIEMKPSGGGIERKLTCTGDFSNEELERIAKLYENRIDRHTFSGRFDRNLPKDVGGAGYYSALSTDMGKAAFYSERFRGNDNINDTLVKVQTIADRCVDFLIGWLEHELGDDPNLASLKAFCDKNVRHDVRNLAVYFWLSSISRNLKGIDNGEIPARMMHYVIERGYFGANQMHLLAEIYEGDNDQSLRLLRQWVAEKMGYASREIASERLAFLSDGKCAEESVERYIRTTDVFAEAWEAKRLKENDPNAEPPRINVGDVILHDIDFDFDILSWSESKVEVRLTCTNKLFATNGKIDEQAKQIVWSETIAGNDGLPTFFYASWSQPDEKFQQEHFGRVVLGDEALARYCAWRANLGQAQGKEWDTFVAGLKPGQDLEGRLKNFRFSSDQQKTPDEEKSDLAQVPRELILAGLKSEEEKTDDTTRIDKE